MNIFYTNSIPEICASEHCRVHRVKMILEYCQLLSTAHHVLDNEKRTDIYKRTHENHPSSIWVRSSRENYLWVWRCARELIKLHYSYRGKEHKSLSVLMRLTDAPKNIVDADFSPPVQCVPDEFISYCSLTAYKNYLNYKFSEWRSRVKPIKIDFDFGVPKWFIEI